MPVKYADDKGNKWTGRGRPPLWLVAAEKAGRKRGLVSRQDPRSRQGSRRETPAYDRSYVRGKKSGGSPWTRTPTCSCRLSG